MLPFYFVAERTHRSLLDVRAMPGCEFFSWLNYHGFAAVLDRKK